MNALIDQNKLSQLKDTQQNLSDRILALSWTVAELESGVRWTDLSPIGSQNSDS